MPKTLRTCLTSITATALFLLVGTSAAQLPPDAVDLAEVKIPETLATIDLCPVTLQPSSAEAATWTWNGTDYRACGADDKAACEADPAKHAAAHAK